MIEDLKRIYSNKRVFLTGHTGFKGAWLLKLLCILEADIKGYALAPECDTNLYSLLNGPGLCESIIDDIRNRDRLINEIKKFKPDFIFHLAAQPLVRLSYDIPADTFEINAIGSAYVLDAVRALNNPCNVIMITTDKVYYNNEWIYPYRESDRLGGYDPYSASKACAELLIDSYRNSFFNIADYSVHEKAIAVARAGNVIGGGDWATDRLVPDIVRAISEDKEIIIRNPRSIRPWQHVLEPLLGYLSLGLKLNEDPIKYSEAFNFGPYNDDTISVEDIVKTAISYWGKGTFKTRKDLSDFHETGLLKLDINKSLNEVGWRPKLNAKRAVELTVGWYKKYYNSKSSISEYTESQILNYLNG